MITTNGGLSPAPESGAGARSQENESPIRVLSTSLAIQAWPQPSAPDDTDPVDAGHLNDPLNLEGWFEEYVRLLRQEPPTPQPQSAIGRMPWIRPCPEQGDGVHCWILAAAWDCTRAGMNARDAYAAIEKLISRSPGYREIEDAIEKAYACSVVSQGPRPPRITAEYDAAELQRIADILPDFSVSDLKRKSVVDPDACTPASYLHALYRPGEKVVVFNDHRSQGQCLWERAATGLPHDPEALTPPSCSMKSGTGKDNAQPAGCLHLRDKSHPEANPAQHMTPLVWEEGNPFPSLRKAKHTSAGSNSQHTKQKSCQKRSAKKEVKAPMPVLEDTFLYIPPTERRRPQRQKTRYKRRDPNMPWNQKGGVCSDPDCLERREIQREIWAEERVPKPTTLSLKYRYDQKKGIGTCTIVNETTGESHKVEIEAANARHFKLLALQHVLRSVPQGNVIVQCDEVAFVEHFHQAQWKQYRGNGWKTPNGDKLTCIPLYQELDAIMANRVVSIQFPPTKPATGGVL